MGGVEFANVEDCWGRDLRFINSDNGVMVAYVSCLGLQQGNNNSGGMVALEGAVPGEGRPMHTCATRRAAALSHPGG